MATITLAAGRPSRQPTLRSAAIAAALGFLSGCVNHWEKAYQGERLAPVPAEATVELVETDTLAITSKDVPAGYRRLGGCDSLGIACSEGDLVPLARSVSATRVEWRRVYLGGTERQVVRNTPVYDRVKTTGTVTNPDGSVSTIDTESTAARWEERTYVVTDEAWWHGAKLFAPAPSR